MRRLAAFSLLTLGAVLLQTTLFERATLFGVAPDLILIVVICMALLEGPTVGAVSGFGAGLLRDLHLETPKGITALTYLVVGYVVGSVRPYVQSTSVLLPISAVFVGSLSGSALYEVVSLLLGGRPHSLKRGITVVLLTAVYNTLLVPFVYPLVRKITTVYKTEKVYRW